MGYGQENKQAKEGIDVTEIQLSIYNVYPLAKCTAMHKNKLSTKLSYLGNNKGSGDLIQIPLSTDSPHPKDISMCTLTCIDTDLDLQTAPSVAIMFYNNTVSKPFLSPYLSTTIIKVKTNLYLI